MSTYIKSFYPVDSFYYLATDFRALSVPEVGESVLFQDRSFAVVKEQGSLSMEKAYLGFANGEAYILDQTGFTHSLILGAQLPPLVKGKPFQFKLLPSYFFEGQTQQWLTLVDVSMGAPFHGRYVMPLMGALLVHHYLEGTSDAFQAKTIAAWTNQPDPFQTDMQILATMVSKSIESPKAYGFFPEMWAIYSTLVDTVTPLASASECKP